MGERHINGRGYHMVVMEIDACFRDERGNAVLMSFHHFCGPHFEDKHEKIVEPTDAIWNQFYGWWNAKGRLKYAPGSEPVAYVPEHHEDELVTLKVRGTGGYVYELVDVPISEIVDSKAVKP